jgi:3-oxoacyl-[acyl-carrier protein] reductase
MDLGLEGKVVLVNAASKGLGFATAMQFAYEGANLVIASRDEARIAEAARQISEKTGAQVIPQAADVSKAEDIKRLMETVSSRFGRLDVLVTNAGGPPGGPFVKFSDEDWTRAFELNLLSVVRLVRESLPLLKQSDGGRIIAIASSSVKQPIPGLILSNVMRMGILGLMKTLAIELAEDGILVNVVSPGRIATDRVRELDEARASAAGLPVEQIKEQFQQNIPLKRYGEPEEFGKMVVFLASSANTYVTGSSLLVDGGMIKAI